VTRFILRRLLVSIPVLLGIIFIVFALARLVPGDPCRAVLGERATDAVCADFIRRYGLDQPLPAQFGIYLGQIARLISAYRRNSPIDVGTMVLANLGVSMPVFVLGLLLAYLFAIVFKDTPLALPPSGRLSSGVSVRPIAEVWGLQGTAGIVRGILDFISGIYVISALITGQFGAWIDAMRHLILPALALGTIPLAIIARITRSSLLEVLGQDYVRTARAKGLRETGVILRHATRNALLPVVTIIGLQLGALLSGAVLTETVFNLAGVGRSLYEAITGRDYVVIQGFTLVIAVTYVLVNLIVDVSYGYLDPRVRLA
jgi:peptide/nickel transport system permease protein